MISLSNTPLELLEVVLEFAWECVVNATFPALLLAVVVLAVQWTCSRWLRPAQLGLLWGIVLVRLMLPVAPQSPFSLQTVFRAADAPAPADPWAQSAPTSAPAGDMEPRTYTPAAPEVVEASLVDSALDWLPMIWLLGCVLILAVTVCRYMLFAFRLRRRASTSDPRLISLVDECRSRLFVRRAIRTAVTDSVRQPAVLGVWRPQLLLPPHVLKLSDADLRMVLLHELAHVRCQDLAVNWLLLAVRAVHWANPVYWLAVSRFLNLREQSRDAMVLRALEGDARHEYSALLLTLAGQRAPTPRWRVLMPGLLPGLVCGLFEKRAVASRLKAIHRAGTPQPMWQLGIAVMLFTGVLITGCTDPSVGSTGDAFPEPDHFTQLAMQRGFGRMRAGSNSRIGRADAEPLETQSYDITAAIKRIAEIHDVDADTATEAVRLQTTGFIVRSLPPNPTDGKASEIETPTATVRVDGERRLMDVLADQAAHRQVEQTIAAWEQSGLAQITVEIRMASSPIDLAFRGHVAWTSISASTVPLPPPTESPDSTTSVTGTSAIEQRLPVMMAVAHDSKIRRIIHLLQSHERSNINFAPKITMFNGQSGSITDSTMRPFVTGVRLVDGRREPQIDVCADGIELQLRAVLAADRATTQLSGRALLSKLLDVKTSSTQFTDGPVTIQVPHVERRTIDFRSDLRDEESLVIACPPSSDGKDYFYLLLTPRPLTDAETGPLAGTIPAP